jgi:hypothetical protein
MSGWHLKLLIILPLVWLTTTLARMNDWRKVTFVWKQHGGYWQ